MDRSTARRLPPASEHRQERQSRSRSRMSRGPSTQGRSVSAAGRAQAGQSPSSTRVRSPQVPPTGAEPTGHFRQLPKVPKYVGTFDGMPENYGRWLTRFEAWADSLGLSDAHKKVCAMGLLTGKAQQWADYRMIGAVFNNASWSELLRKMTKGLRLDSDERCKEILDESLKAGHSLRHYYDRKRWAGEQLGRSETTIKKAIVSGLPKDHYCLVSNWRDLDLDALIEPLLDYEDIVGSKSTGQQRKRSRSRSPADRKKSRSNKPPAPGGQYCSHCKKNNHSLENCWTKKNADKAAAGQTTKSGPYKKGTGGPLLTGANAVAVVQNDADDPAADDAVCSAQAE